MYKLLVKTDSYAGNFECEMCNIAHGIQYLGNVYSEPHLVVFYTR